MRHISIAILFLAAATGTQAQTLSGGDSARGKTLYMRDACYTCHGSTGASTSFVGPKLAHPGLAPAQILRQLRQPRGQMPVYTQSVLSDADAADIIAYIQTLSTGPTPTGKDIPLLNR